MLRSAPVRQTLCCHRRPAGLGGRVLLLRQPDLPGLAAVHDAGVRPRHAQPQRADAAVPHPGGGAVLRGVRHPRRRARPGAGRRQRRGGGPAGPCADDARHHAGARRRASSRMAVHIARDLDTVRQFAAGAGALAFIDLPWAPIYLAAITLLHPWLGVYAVGSAHRAAEPVAGQRACGAAADGARRARWRCAPTSSANRSPAMPTARAPWAWAPR